MRKISLIVCFILLSLTIFGCSSPTEPANDQTQQELKLPEPKDSTAVVHGYLLSSSGEPINESIFLSKDVAYGQPDLPVTISFSLQSDPRGFLDTQTGQFYFDNVEPGMNYVITIFAGSGEPTFVMEDNSGQPMVFEVKAGESLDLGELIVNMK